MTSNPMSYLEDPRVFFAAERTLLSWQRTAIAVIGLGLLSAARPAVAHGRLSSVFAVLFLCSGALAAVISAWQYTQFLKALSAPELPRGHMTWPGPALNTVLAAAAITMALWFVLST
jgi:putative membrane protein